MKPFILLLLSIAVVLGLTKGIYWLLIHHLDTTLEVFTKVCYGVTFALLVAAVWTILLKVFHKDES